MLKINVFFAMPNTSSGLAATQLPFVCSLFGGVGRHFSKNRKGVHGFAIT